MVRFHNFFTVKRVKKTLDSVFFTPVPVPRAQAPVIASENNANLKVLI